MKKIVLMLVMALSLQAASATYAVKYKGMTLGEIKDLSTLKELYLKADVTSRVARFLLGKDSLVYYGGKRPDIKKAKYKQDKKMMLYAFSQSLNERPKFKRYEINPIKNITLSCKEDMCEFTYYKNNNINGKGKILFDKAGEFVSITEELTDFQIVKK
jgi:phage gpG-like protein